ncbi:MAG: hypothetical protein JNL52_03125, partial [Flavobacteriales bacterium]|nr:hypothetical protein [Flavobacteriales bacterium]
MNVRRSGSLMRRAAMLLALCLPALVAMAQPSIEWTRPWPADTSTVVVSKNDSTTLSWNRPSGIIVSHGIEDRILLKRDPRRTLTTTPMDVHVTIGVRALTNPDHGDYNAGDDSTTYQVFDLYIGVRGADLAPAGLDRTLDRIDQAGKHFSDAHAFTVKLLDIEVNEGSGYTAVNELPEGIYFDLYLLWRRDPPLNLNNGPTNPASAYIACTGPGTATNAYELELSWTGQTGALRYDVEWTWVDDYDYVPATGTVATGALPDSHIHYDLDRNASRATVNSTQTYYRLPLLYDRGYIVWRVRSVGAAPGQPGLFVHTAWSGPALPSGTVGSITPTQYRVQVAAHHASKNWQVTTSFAEEGKRKEVMTYADGTSRARQMVTRNNSLYVPIIGETVYDATGRAAVQVMPVPKVKDGCLTAGQSWAPIDYNPDFNMEDSLGSSSRFDYWDLQLQPNSCDLQAGALHTVNGAERYYSEAFATDNAAIIEAPDHLPRAEGYAYAQTQYTRDNTGRVRKQGGVGATFQLNGHATTTYYGKPEQIQLDRLFGSEAGYSMHYQRIVTVDPNGQASVTYVDMFGRTVATALSCLETTSGLEELEHEPVELTTDLFSGLPSTSPQLGQRRGDELFFTTQFAVACSSTYEFTYGVQPLMLEDNCWGNENRLCPNCVYELTIRIVNECGEQVFQYPPVNAPAIVGHVQSSGPEGLVPSFICWEEGPAYHTAPPADLVADLPPGEYTLTKSLRLHTGARDHFVQQLLDPANNDTACFRTLDEFIDEAIQNVGLEGCDVGCAACFEALGSLEDFLASGQGTEAEYQALRQECDELCRVDSWCDVLLMNMRADMELQGQYGRFEWDGNTANAPSFPDRTSVFIPEYEGSSILRDKFTHTVTPTAWNEINWGLGLWRQPWLELDGQVFQEYRDMNGDPARIPVEPDGANFTPEVVDVNAVVQEGPNTCTTTPQNLALVQDFLDAWESGWERSLVRFHPEYCYYMDCRQYGQPNSAEDPMTSDAFDGKLTLANTASEAFELGLVNSSGQPVFLGADPFITNSIYDPYGAELQARINLYYSAGGSNYSMVQMAAITARCNGVYSGPACTDFGTGSMELRDAEWAALRGFYRSVKYELQLRRAEASVKDCACAGLNYCIGEDDLNDWWYRMLAMGPSNWWQNWGSQPQFQGCQPCHVSRFPHYSNKEKRVNDPGQLPGLHQSPMELAYQNFLQTGQCPLATAWVQLFLELANRVDHPLANGGSIQLQNSPGWAAVHLALNNMEMGTTPPAADLNIFNLASEIVLSTTSGCDVTLYTPTGATDFAWDRITHISTLVADPNSYAFTLHVYYNMSDGTPAVTPVEGVMCAQFDLAPCNFPRVCEPNQLAFGVQDLFNMVKSGGQWMAAPLALSSYVPPGASTPAQELLSQSVKAWFTTTPDLSWSYSATGPKIYVRDLNAPGTVRFRFDILEAEPVSFAFNAATWATVAYFGNITGDHENFFTVQGFDGTGNVTVSLRCQAWFEENGDVRPVALGLCGLPENALCTDPQFTLDDQLAQVFQDLIYGTGLNTSTVDLFSSPNMTDALAWTLCPPGPTAQTPVAAPGDVATYTNLYKVDVCECLTVSVPRSGGLPVGTGLDLEGITPMNSTTEGTFTTFRVPILPNGLQFVTFSSSCHTFASCDTCRTRPRDAQSLIGLNDEQLLAQQVLNTDSIWDHYQQYLAAVDSLNERLGPAVADSGHVTALSYGEFRRKGYWHSLKAYQHYLRNYKPTIDNPTYLHQLDSFVVAHSNALNVKAEYKRYVSAVEHYNTLAAAAAQPTVTPAGDSLFTALLLADIVPDYVDLLDGLTPAAILPPDIATLADMDGDDPCVNLYLNTYLPAYWHLATDSTGRCPDLQKYAPLVSYKEFLAANICCSDSGLVVFDQYIQQFLVDSLKCPSYFPQLKECGNDSLGISALKKVGEDCQYLYSLWFNDVKKYMGPPPVPYQVHTGIVLDLTYLSFEEFAQAGLCECVQEYLTYLKPYLSWNNGLPGTPINTDPTTTLPNGDPSLPPLLSIDEYCNGGPNDCEDHFRAYVTTVRAFNGSAYSDSMAFDLRNDFTKFSDFEEAKLCWCVEAYNAYLQGYLHWTAESGNWPRPLTIQEFCRSRTGPDCSDMYHLYVTRLITLQPVVEQINGAFNNEFKLFIVDKKTFDLYGLCWCVKAYLARLELYLSDPETYMAELENEENHVWNLLKFCTIPTPCPPQDPIPPTPSLPIEQSACVCCDELTAIATLNAHSAYEAYIDSLTRNITERYTETCLGAAETFRMNFPDQEHHYTLYYYDQAGSLVRTVPPEGVQLTDIVHPNDSVAVRIARDRTQGVHSYFTDHRLTSDHVYNSLGQPIRSSMPDQDPRNEWKSTTPLGLAEGMTITGVTFGEGGKGFLSGYLSGDRGLAYTTTDGGLTWQRSNGLVGADLYGVHYPTPTDGYAVGDHGTLLRTTNGGASWSLLPNALLETRPALRDVRFISATDGLMVGLNGDAAFTTNSGTSVTTITGLGTDHLYGAGFDGTHFYLGGSTNDGTTGRLYTRAGLDASGWNQVADTRTAAELTCGQAATTTDIYVAGHYGVLLHSSNGAQWTTRRTGTTWDFIDVAFRNADHGVAILDSVGERGVLRHTTDGGATWHPVADLPHSDLRDLYLVRTEPAVTEVLAVGAGGRVFRLFLGVNGDNEATMGWAQVQGLGTTADLTRCWAAYEGTALRAMVVNGNTAYISLNLTAQPVAWTTHSLGAWQATDVLGLFSGGQWRMILAATNGSTQRYLTSAWNMTGSPSWSTSTATNVGRIALRSDNKAVVSVNGAAALLVDLSNNTFPVTSLTAVNTPPTASNALITLPTTEEVVSAGPTGSLFIANIPSGTTCTWTNTSTKITPLPIHAVHKDGGWAAAAQGTVLRRNGTSWTALPTRTVQDLRGVEPINANLIVAVGDESAVLRMDPAAPSTYNAPTVMPSGTLHAVRAMGNAVHLAADAGRIWYCPDITAATPTFTALNVNAGAVRALAANTAVGDQSLVHTVVGTTRMVVHELYTPRLHSIWTNDGLRVHTVGDANTVRTSTNGGLTWQVVPVTGPLTTLRAVQGNATGTVLAVGNTNATGNRQVLALSGTTYAPQTLSGGNTTDVLHAVAVSGTGAVVVAAANAGGSAGGAYRRTPNGTWSHNAYSQPVTAVWSFPNYMADAPGIFNETSHEDFLIGGQSGHMGYVRYVPGTNSFPSTPSAWGAASGLVGNVRAFWFHDQVNGFAVVNASTGSQLYRVALPLNRANTGTWSNSATLLNLTNEPDAAPLCIAFADRERGFVGGSQSTTPVGLARTLTDEGGLYSQRFWYDALGRLVLSQNSKQFNMATQRFSYSLYDELGRVYEAGELEDDGNAPDRFQDLPATNVNGALLPNVLDPDVLKAWVLGRPRFEVTRTYYDAIFPSLTIPGFAQENLRLRVASTVYYDAWEEGTTPEADYAHATHYSYDIHGNVKTLVQDHPQLGIDGGAIQTNCTGCVEHRYKRMDYTYDLISGNVRQVDYQKDQPDAIHHRYTYDADNRITEVETSADAQNWHHDARYFYYPHGPLQRVELGEHLVQGTDYAYTLQGWLKGINGDRLNPTTDMGRDGDATVVDNPNLLTGRDAYALSLGYYGDNDYKAIASSYDSDSPANIAQRPFAPIGGVGTMNTEHTPLYNGNIAHTVNTLQHFGLWDATNGDQGQVLAMVYRYDQLNRLRTARGVIGLGSTNTWNTVADAATNRYRSEYTYDANGNIETAQRWNATGAARYDSLHYHYHDASGRRLRNRLYHLQDLAADGIVTAPDPDDLKKTTLAFDTNLGTLNTNASTNNYRYDALGNLVYDNREGITN